MRLRRCWAVMKLRLVVERVKSWEVQADGLSDCANRQLRLMASGIGELGDACSGCLSIDKVMMFLSFQDVGKKVT